MHFHDFDSVVTKTDDGVEMRWPVGVDCADCTVCGCDMFFTDEGEKEELVYSEIYRKFGISFFFFGDKPPELPYCVPYLEVFAFDGDGLFAADDIGCPDASKVLYLPKDGSVLIYSASMANFIADLQDGSFKKSSFVSTSDFKIFSSQAHARSVLRNFY